MPVLSSPANPLLKDVRRATRRGVLTSEGLMIAESFHLLEEVFRSGCAVPVLLAAESARGEVERRMSGRGGVRVVTVAEALFQKVAGTETSQGVIALVRPPVWSLPQLFRGQSLVMVLDGVQDPGNAGAIVRAAEAFGASGVLFLKGTVSPFNPKTLRASAGSLFRMPFLHGLEPDEGRAVLEQHRLGLYAAVPDGANGLPAAQVDFTRPCGIVIGSEGHGVSAVWRGAAREVTIPTAGVESLNAAMAAAILLYEARRQRGGS